MEKYINLIVEAYTGYFWYLWYEITHPHLYNFVMWLLLVSAFFFSLELIKPWRVEQPRFRRDFWLDFFYMFFNFFLFSLLIFSAASSVAVNLFNDFLGLFGITNLVALQIGALPYWGHVLLLFIVGDFLSWNVHRLLHRVPFLWEFHKLHHSVKEMGFAAHLRYHWMENIVYSTLKYIPLTMLGFDLVDLFMLHIFNLVVGHYNHSNITVDGKVTGGIFGALIGVILYSSYPDLGVGASMTIFAISIGTGVLLLGKYMKILFNSPEMHIWHHAYDIPKELPYGVNFGITLAIWDYIWKTNYIPHDGRDIRLGFPEDETYPKKFLEQVTSGFGK